MNITEAAQQFVDAHKPSRIDVSHIEDFYGSVECFIETDQCAYLGDMGEYQIEVRGMDTKSGTAFSLKDGAYEEDLQSYLSE